METRTWHSVIHCIVDRRPDSFEYFFWTFIQQQHVMLPQTVNYFLIIFVFLTIVISIGGIYQLCLIWLFYWLFHTQELRGKILQIYREISLLTKYYERNTANVTGGKTIAAILESFSGVNLLISLYSSFMTSKKRMTTLPSVVIKTFTQP
jgi:hypothetical protein